MCLGNLNKLIKNLVVLRVYFTCNSCFDRNVPFPHIVVTFQIHKFLQQSMPYILLHFGILSVYFSRGAVPFGPQTGLACIFWTHHTVSVQITGASPVAWCTASNYDSVGQGLYSTQNQESPSPRTEKCTFALCICCCFSVYYYFLDILATVQSTYAIR